MINKEVKRQGGEESQSGIKALQEKLGYWFKTMDRLELALTHSSWASDLKKGGSHNERLEFLGDAVLELCVSSELFDKFPQAREGDLTRLRSQLVNTVFLADLARKIGLPSLLKLGRGEDMQGGRERDTVLSDALEAVLAAVYLDGGFLAARQTVKTLYNGLWPESCGLRKEPDNKTRLQELTHSLFQSLPVYNLRNTSGPSHARVFEVSLRLPDGRTFQASDSSCKRAEQKAAGMALLALGRAEEKK